MRGRCGEYVVQLCEAMPVNHTNKSRSVQYNDGSSDSQLFVNAICQGFNCYKYSFKNTFDRKT